MFLSKITFRIDEEKYLLQEKFYKGKVIYKAIWWK